MTLLDHPFHVTSTNNRIIAPRHQSGALLRLSFEARRRDAIDDPDEHEWETVWMNPAAAEAEPADRMPDMVP